MPDVKYFVLNSFERQIFNEVRSRGLLSPEKIEEIALKLKNVEGSLEGVLVEFPKISSEVLLEIKSKVGNLPTFSQDDVDALSAELLGHIPEEAAQQYKIVPLGVKGKTLKVGMVNPTDYKARDAIRFISMGSDIIPELYVITQASFQKVLGQYRTFRTQIGEALTELESELREEKKTKKIPEGPRSAEEVLKEAPITKVVAVMLKHAVEGNASDIHVEATPGRTRVRFRVHGKLYTSLYLPTGIHGSVVSRIKILSSLRLDEMRVPQDGRFSAEVSGRTIDFRVSTFPTRLGEKVVLRVLDPSRAVTDFTELGIVGRNLEIIQEAVKKPFGMIVISGPTGSGKSTTLYAALMSIDKEMSNVVSLEDPIEYHIEGVSQSQVRPDIGYTFAEGLRHVLRQDPDIIMVGEMRDAETANLATHAALTGHLVFTTLHTNNAVGVVSRLIDMGVPSFLLPGAIAVAIAQRLVRKLCPHCKAGSVSPPGVSQVITAAIRGMNEDTRSRFKLQPKDSYEIWNSPGCGKCVKRGTLGRIAIFESLVMTKELKEIVYHQPNELEIAKESVRQGMVTLHEDAIIKALQGIISMDEVFQAAENQ